MSLSTFDVVAEPNRRRILDLLCSEERSVSDLVERLSLSQPSVSKHLKVLREARLVRARVSAQRRVYRLNPAPLRELEVWLEPYRKFWAERLDALGQHLDERARKGSRAGSVGPGAARATERPRGTPARHTRRNLARRKPEATTAATKRSTP
ncbi:MAG TPA: metalloregulator ArsR/SmtB family transcription factor [Polyangiaceae bacterium]|nr:metalloregulator ArsR/SmtB family transcription factor [Polyangiaceae bacterium]